MKEVVIDGAAMCCKRTIQYQGFHVGIPCTAHNSNRGAHGVGNCAKPHLRVAPFRISHCSKKVIDFAEAKRYGPADYFSMPIDLKGQAVIPCFPHYACNPRHIGYLVAISS